MISVSSPAFEARLPQGPSLAAVVLLSSGCLLALTVWAALTRVEVVAMVPAAARPDIAAAELRAPQTRIVSEVRIAAGGRVAAGQRIVRLDAAAVEVAYRAAVSALAGGRRTLEAQRRFLKWLDAGADPQTIEAAAIDEPERARMREHAGQVALLDDEIRVLRVELQSVARNVDASRRLLEVARERYQAITAANQRDAVSHFVLLQARQAFWAEQRNADSVLGERSAAEARLTARRDALNQTRLSVRSGLLTAIEEAGPALATLRSRLAELAEQRRGGWIVAPVAGVVDRLDVVPGVFVERGESVGRIVPDTAPLVFEARVAPSQAALVKPGQLCRLKLDAFPFARYGAVPCRVEAVTADVAEADSGTGYYRARVRPALDTLRADGRTIRLRPGATGWVDLIAGQRTVLSFVTEPLWRFTRQALREP